MNCTGRWLFRRNPRKMGRAISNHGKASVGWRQASDPKLRPTPGVAGAGYRGLQWSGFKEKPMLTNCIGVAALAGALGVLPAFAAGMSVSFDWGPTKKCFDPKSPPFSITGVPTGTRTLTFRMVDRNAPDFDHGGGEVAFGGQRAIPYGAFRYRGPCPPQGSHTYAWTVKALDAGGKVLATGTAQRKFP